MVSCVRSKKRDSALGEQFDKIENFVKGTTAKVANLPQNFQNLQSPTAIPRILEEEKQSDFEKSASLSSRAAKSGVAIHKSAQVDSTFLPFALDSSSTRISSLKGGQGGYLRSVPPYPPLFFHSFCPQSPCTLSK